MQLPCLWSTHRRRHDAHQRHTTILGHFLHLEAHTNHPTPQNRAHLPHRTSPPPGQFHSHSQWCGRSSCSRSHMGLWCHTAACSRLAAPRSAAPHRTGKSNQGQWRSHRRCCYPAAGSVRKECGSGGACQLWVSSTAALTLTEEENALRHWLYLRHCVQAHNDCHRGNSSCKCRRWAKRIAARRRVAVVR